MLYTAFLMGLLGSFHCIGMCGPIAFMLPLDHTKPVKKVSAINYLSYRKTSHLQYYRCFIWVVRAWAIFKTIPATTLNYHWYSTYFSCDYLLFTHKTNRNK